MKHLLFFLFLVAFCDIKSVAQFIINPTFDRADTPSFRVEKVRITPDTTYVYCTYQADEDSWANISPDTYIKDIQSGACFPLLKASGLPLSPERILFTNNISIPVCLFFPHINTDKFDIIEIENKEAFNIYGINTNQTYTDSYTSEDIATFFNLSQKEEEMENWQSAINYSLKQLDAADYVDGIRSFPSACAMYNLTMQLILGTKDYIKAIEWGKKAIDIINSLPQDSMRLDVLARAYGNVGTAYHLMGQHEKGKQYEELSLATRRLKEGVGVLSYEKYLAKLAKDNYYEMNYPKALLYGREVAIIFEQMFKENSRKYSMVYLNALNNLSQYYGSMNKIDEGYECANRAYRLIANGDAIVEDWLKYSVYNNFAVALSSVGRTEESIELLELLQKETNRKELRRININSRLLLAFMYMDSKQDTIRATQEYTEILKAMEDSIGTSYSFPEYTSVLHHLRELYKNTDADKSRDYLKKEIQTYEEWKTNESIAYANLLLEYIDDTWIESVLEDSKTDSLLLYLRRATNIIKRHINYSSYNMSKNEREYYWQRYRNVFTWLIPTISGIAPSKEANSLAYDASLFYKSLLLASEKEYKEVILSSNDSVLIRQYNEYVGHLVFLENMYMRGSPSPFIDSLRTIIRDEEFLLSQRVTRFDRQYKGTNYSWEEIRNSLTPDDVAIEFVSYDAVGDSTMYYEAYMIDSNSAYPQLVYICNEGDLRRLVRMDSIDYNGLSMLIWGNKGLDSFLKGKKNVYFSASGLLNSIGIEYLPIADGKSIQDVYNIYRLSSTRELCFSHEYINPQDVCLYGGLDYNSPCQIRGDDTRQTYRVSRAVVDSLVSRGGFEPLIGSKQEIDIVKNEMSKNGIICRTYTDSEGTEESLKKLSGCQMNILHLSTHGMFVPFEEEECQVKQINNFRFLLSKESPNVDLESAALSHSFLVMSGGNLLIHRDGLQEGAEDGILTALEISHLDFHDLDLVVLSACQTALGVIGSDGVYGLQRGFKKAGANTILMSLDKVDDEATRIQMVEFYKNLMEGKSKHQSLKDAQHYLRQVENGKYDDPKYWASFIMLDGLN